VHLTPKEVYRLQTLSGHTRQSEQDLTEQEILLNQLREFSVFLESKFSHPTNQRAKKTAQGYQNPAEKDQHMNIHPDR
jgi:hypothetical protein